MKVSIMQPSIFMWGGLLKSIIDSDLHIILDVVSSSKNSRYNRNKIEGKNDPIWLTIPFIEFKRSKLIMNQKLNTSKESNLKLINIFTNRYSEADHFEDGLKVLQSTLYSEAPQTYINQVYVNFLNALKSLDLPICKIKFASSLFEKNELEDLPKGIELVNLILKKINAETYLASENTANYCYASDYEIKNIYIQKFCPSNYNQDKLKKNNFTPNLSCLDLISYLDIDELIQNLKQSNKWEKLTK